MRSRLPLISALLALALMLGPAVASVHDDSDHGLQPGAAHCVVCAYAHSAGTGALPAMPLLALGIEAEAPELPVVENPLAATLRHHPIRGPPALLV